MSGLVTRFGRNSFGFRSDTPLTDEQLFRVAPSIFATGKHESRSDRYTYIPTIEVYDLSDNGLRKHCKRLGIPLPYPGYWARVKSGQDLDRTPLPKVVGELEHCVREYVIKYRPKFEDFSDDKLKNNEELSLVTDATKAFIQAACSKIQVPGQLRNPHKLIIDHEKESRLNQCFPSLRQNKRK